MSCESFNLRCKCYEKCEPKRECGCYNKREPRRECECYNKCEPKRECGCESEHDRCKEYEWLEKELKEAYWKGFKDGCRKCGRKENEYGDCGCDGYEEYKRQ